MDLKILISFNDPSEIEILSNWHNKYKENHHFTDHSYLFNLKSRKLTSKDMLTIFLEKIKMETHINNID